MGIYLNEAGAHTKYINKEYEKFNKYRNKANELKEIAKESPSREKIRDKANEYTNKAHSIMYDIAGRYGDINDIHKYANKGKHLPTNGNNDPTNYIYDIKGRLGVGKNNIPKDRDSDSYLKAQNRLRGIKEACEYILDMLDEEYYYDEYED